MSEQKRKFIDHVIFAMIMMNDCYMADGFIGLYDLYHKARP